MRDEARKDNTQVSRYVAAAVIGAAACALLAGGASASPDTPAMTGSPTVMSIGVATHGHGLSGKVNAEMLVGNTPPSTAGRH